MIPADTSVMPKKWMLGELPRDMQQETERDLWDTDDRLSKREKWGELWNITNISGKAAKREQRGSFLP